MTAQAQSNRLSEYLTLLRNNKNFRLLWFGQIVSLLGDWFNLIASAALIALLTESGAAVGGLFVVRFMAPFLVSPVAGVFADRYSRKQILIITDILRGITVLGFLFVRSPEHVWIVYVLTAIQMGGQGFFVPASNAMLPDITEPHELGTANALSSATWSTMLAFGAALGGLFAGLWGPYPPFILDALTFFGSALLLQRIAYQQPEELIHSEKSIAAGFRQYFAGLSYLRRHKDILIIALQKMSNALFISGAFQVIQIFIAENYFPIGEGGGVSLGLMYAFTGIGTGVGPIVARLYARDDIRKLRITILVGFILSMIGLFCTATLANLPIVLVGAVFRGVGGGTVWVMSTQLLLQLLPVDVRGRIFASEFALATLGNAVGAGIAGAMLDINFDLSTLMTVMAISVLLPISLWTFWLIYHPEKAKM